MKYAVSTLTFLILLISCFDGTPTFSSKGEGGISDSATPTDPLVIEPGDEIAEDPPEATPTGPITITSTPLITGEEGVPIRYEVKATSSTNLVLSYSLTSAPMGMRIFEKTGVLYWTPAKGQTTSGNVTITVTDTVLPVPNTATQTLNIAVADKGLDYSNQYFVALAPYGDSGHTGSPDSPFDDIRRACDSGAGAGATVYVRGGIYRAADWGTGLNPSGFRQLQCNGAEGSPITIKPWGNEKVKFEVDSFVGLRIKGNHVILEGFEIEGPNKRITFEEAYKDWWIGNNYYNGGGIVPDGHHITVKNNIVHHVPGAGINANSCDCEYITIKNNIVYNSAWWSTKGTTGIGAVSIDSIESAPTSDNSTNVEIIGNLVFGTESRVFSRVFGKGFSELEIDEGEALLVQSNGKSYQGRYLVKDNFFLFNGKGSVINTTDKADVENNTLYLNGTTIGGLYWGLRGNKNNDIKNIRNAVQVGAGGYAYSYGSEEDAALWSNVENYLIGDDKDKATPPTGKIFVNEIFKDPDNLDFSLAPGIPSYVGASGDQWDILKDMAVEYEIEIKPAGWANNYDQNDLESKYEEMTKWIVENSPGSSTPDFTNGCGLDPGDNDGWPHKVCVKGIDYTLPGLNGSLKKLLEDNGRDYFELRLNYPYTPAPFP